MQAQESDLHWALPGLLQVRPWGWSSLLVPDPAAPQAMVERSGQPWGRGTCRAGAGAYSSRAGHPREEAGWEGRGRGQRGKRGQCSLSGKVLGPHTNILWFPQMETGQDGVLAKAAQPVSPRWAHDGPRLLGAEMC